MLVGLLATVAASPPAAGYDFEVTARTEAYGYQLRRIGADGVGLLNRRRVTQYLGLRVFNLLDPGQQPHGPGGRLPALLMVHAQLRFQTDFGAYVRPNHEIPEIENNQLHLMVGALEGRNLLGGWLDFTVGRQYDAELMDFFAYDGIRVRINLPWLPLHAESHFGVQLARAREFTVAVFETDGTSAGTADEAWSPTFGIALGLEGLAGVDARVAYRGTASRAPAEPGEAGRDGPSVWGLDQELLFASAGYQVPVVRTRALVGVRYNLLLAALDDLHASLVQPFGSAHRVHLDYLRSQPHFDGDSIFNIFSIEPFDEWSAGYSWRVLRPLTVEGRIGWRRLWADPDEVDPGRDAVSASLGAHWRERGEVAGGLELFYLGGAGGTILGGDLVGSWRMVRWLSLEGRLSLVNVDDPRHTAGDVLTFGAQAGAGVRFLDRVRLHLLLENNVSRLYDSALRLLAVLDLGFAP